MVTTISMNTGTNGCSTYENFAFNSMVLINGKYYGASANGIFELGGETDAGVKIAAHVESGDSKLFSDNLAAAGRAYVTADTPTTLDVSIVVDSVPHGPFTTEDKGRHDTSRVLSTKLPKGAQGSLWRVRVGNNNGNAFDLSEVKLDAVKLSRRHR